LVVGQRRISRFQGWIAFGLEATDDINDADQTHLAHPLHPHDTLCVHLPFLVWSSELSPRWLDQVVMRLITARQACLFEEPGDLCSTGKRLVWPGGICLECS